MSDFEVKSRCECQATLSATLDAQRLARAGRATFGGSTELAPAHSIGADEELFDVAWMCPFCGRNTIRSVRAPALPPAGESAAS